MYDIRSLYLNMLKVGKKHQLIDQDNPHTF